tara:strand:+ start:2085 stop:2354 length:270 start_codon:yes stop_codon:yes gene_type:complete
MLHEDMKDILNPDEVVELAYSEFGRLFDAADEFEVKIGSDDGGRTLDLMVIGSENATLLRTEVPPRYNGYRTVIVYRYDPPYELNTEEE